MFSTTINIHGIIFFLIEKICLELNISKSFLIKKIITYTCYKLNSAKYGRGLTCYQRKMGPRRWKCFHVEFSEQECKLFFECRAKFRISVSKLLLIGVILFLKEIIEELKLEKTKASEKIFYSYTRIQIQFYKNIEKELWFFNFNRENPQ